MNGNMSTADPSATTATTSATVTTQVTATATDVRVTTVLTVPHRYAVVSPYDQRCTELTIHHGCATRRHEFPVSSCLIVSPSRLFPARVRSRNHCWNRHHRRNNRPGVTVTTVFIIASHLLLSQ